MGKPHTPRSGSMQFWPRSRAKRHIARVRRPLISKEVKLSMFAGYKVGMTHILVIENNKNSPSKGATKVLPVTVIECPPMKIVGVRFYNNSYEGTETFKDIVEKKGTKTNIELVKPEDFDDARLLVSTNPKVTGIGNKNEEVIEIPFGGSKEDKLTFLKEKIGQLVTVKEVFDEGLQLNASAITTGKGYQGPVKRFGIDLRHHKSEKTIRGPGSLGSWKGQGHMMYRVAYAGKMGYNQRTEYNKLVLKISDDPKEINIDGGYNGYGLVKNTYMLVKGSIPGPSKRLTVFSLSKRPNLNVPKEAPSIEEINLQSNQGR